MKTKTTFRDFILASKETVFKRICIDNNRRGWVTFNSARQKACQEETDKNRLLVEFSVSEPYWDKDIFWGTSESEVILLPMGDYEITDLDGGENLKVFIEELC